MDSDAQAIQRYLDGDQEALGALYDRHAPAVFAFLMKRVDAAEAEDVLQETFLHAAKRLESYEHVGKLRGWLLSIARTRSLDRIRARKRHGERGLADGEEERLAHQGPSPLDAQEHRELGDRIRDAVDALPERQREIFLLREEAGLSFKEIAEMLDLPLNTALSHMHRAVKGLREALADLDDATAPEAASRQ